MGLRRLLRHDHREPDLLVRREGGGRRVVVRHDSGVLLVSIVSVLYVFVSLLIALFVGC
jgi:hypothetical protein